MEEGFDAGVPEEVEQLNKCQAECYSKWERQCKQLTCWQSQYWQDEKWRQCQNEKCQPALQKCWNDCANEATTDVVKELCTSPEKKYVSPMQQRL